MGDRLRVDKPPQHFTKPTQPDAVMTVGARHTSDLKPIRYLSPE